MNILKTPILAKKTRAFSALAETRSASLSRRISRIGSSLTLGLVATLALNIFSVAAFASSSSDLERMEQKFFQHSYPKDEMPVRLERLEKMVFGETKTGSDSDRLANLVVAIPAPAADATPPPSTADSTSTTSGGDTSSSSSKRKNSSKTANRTPASSQTADSDSDSGAPVASDEKYPAVTAMELKVLGKDYSGEDINSRLKKLEIKVFGKASTSTDLVDRTDALKQKTGIDIARQAPRGSDWADDDDDDMTMPRSNPVARGRNSQPDYDDAYNPPSRGGTYGSGSYGATGMSGGGASSSGSYGMGGGTRGYPVSSPRSSMSSSMPGASTGMSSGGTSSAPIAPQIAALEIEVFGKNYTKDTLVQRLTRLEGTVFPQDKNPSQKSLPERTARLASVIPINVNSTRAPSRKSSGDIDDLDSSIAGMQQQMRQQTGSSGGLGKVISSLSSMFNGGYTGGYQMQPGAMTTDPQTGMLYDASSGNLIDPNTGAVVGRRSGGSYGGSYSTGGMGGMGGFTNGFSPYGQASPYSSGSYGSSFGIGSGRSSGMWP